ncbi:ATP-binding protein [Streptomyces sp. NPDC004327]|uniref:ATP-binding protein n=1 Tax=Streptomyces sp. NPDC004327 TaxID=3364699 RepID=UPI0036C33B2B
MTTPRPADDPAEDQVRRLVLESARGAVTRCRDFTAAALAEWGWLPAATPEGRERAEDVLLLVSEVVTNACLHAGGPEELVLRHWGGRSGAGGLLRVEVSDPSPAHPRAHGPRSPSQPGGHGLMVLDRLAGAWGWVDKADGAPGKVVWLEVSRPTPQRPGPGSGRRFGPGYGPPYGPPDGRRGVPS